MQTLARECRHCAHWAGAPDAPAHECRRHAPRPAFVAAGARPIWPTTQADHWCGDFEPPDEDLAEASLTAPAGSVVVPFPGVRVEALPPD